MDLPAIKIRSPLNIEEVTHIKGQDQPVQTNILHVHEGSCHPVGQGFLRDPVQAQVGCSPSIAPFDDDAKDFGARKVAEQGGYILGLNEVDLDPRGVEQYPQREAVLCLELMDDAVVI
ncbi:hypothetical protein D3C86_1439520 [compost metagenome]